MVTKNSNSDVHVLVLARPADSVCTILASALCQWRYAFSMHSTVYETVNGLRDVFNDKLPVLITRPAMFGPQAAVFIKRNFPNLRIIGWVDSGEKMSCFAIAQMTANGMVMAGGLDQLQQIIHSFCKTIPQNQPAADHIQAAFPEESERLEYELSDDEITALLGVE